MVGVAQDLGPLAGHLADDAHAESRPREGLSPDDLGRQPDLLAHVADLVLEEQTQGLHEVEREVLGQPAHVVVALDVGRVPRARLDDVGVERALDEEARTVAAPAELERHGLELADEELADDLALGLGVDHARQGIEEPVLGLHVDQLDAELAGERLFDLLAFVLSHEPGVDEDARELAADGLGHERRGDRRVDAARERAEHPLFADLGADRRDLVLDDRGVGPGGGDTGDVVQEIREQLLAELGVGDLRVELHGEEASRHVLHHRDRGPGARGADGEALGRTRDRVTVAHPAGHVAGPLGH